jgi:hypothetical protein
MININGGTTRRKKKTKRTYVFATTTNTTHNVGEKIATDVQQQIKNNNDYIIYLI